jgi:hypothetical protein
MEQIDLRSARRERTDVHSPSRLRFEAETALGMPKIENASIAANFSLCDGQKSTSKYFIAYLKGAFVRSEPLRLRQLWV